MSITPICKCGVDLSLYIKKFNEIKSHSSSKFKKEYEVFGESYSYKKYFDEWKLDSNRDACCITHILTSLNIHKYKNI